MPARRWLQWRRPLNVSLDSLEVFPVKLIFCGLLMLLSLSTPAGQRKSSTKTTEDFREFCALFFSDSTFQQERVKFPLPSLTLKDPASPVDTVLLRETDWHFSDFRYSANSFNVQVYDNFKKRLRSTPERVVSFEGTENGIDLSLYFQRIEGKWYLVKRADLSD